MLTKSLLKMFTNLAASVVVIIMFAIAASAYTLVLRDSRRIEIPDEFTVTRITLTYEMSPGFYRTIQVSMIDIAATERANREAPGSFFKHKVEVHVDNSPVPKAVRTVTNRDLAAFRQRRIESERAYESRRKELGLPTVEEGRQRQSMEEAAWFEEIRANDIAKAREESYWRGRARELRAQIAIVDSQINYVGARVNEVSQNSLNNLVITEVYPTWPNQRSGLPYPNQYPYPNSYPYPNQPYGWPRGPFPGGGYPNPYGYPPINDNSAQRAELTSRLDDLLTRRAGLATQWRLLENEAREARVPQAWLLP